MYITQFIKLCGISDIQDIILFSFSFSFNVIPTLRCEIFGHSHLFKGLCESAKNNFFPNKIYHSDYFFSFVGLNTTPMENLLLATTAVYVNF